MRPASEDGEDQDADSPQGELRPSKSARKRAAHAAQKLGEELINLKAAELQALRLPEDLDAAIREAQRIRNTRGGIARQRQYIGRLMREIDLGPIEAAMAVRRKSGALPP